MAQTTAATAPRSGLKQHGGPPQPAHGQLVPRKRRTPWKSWLLFLLFAGPNVALLVIFEGSTSR